MSANTFIERVKLTPLKWLGAALALIVAVVAIVWAKNGSESDAPAAPQETLALVTAKPPGLQSVAAKVSFTGAIAARYDMAIGAQGEGGRITALFVEAGDRVKRGQLMARLDQSVVQPQVARLAASLEEARAQAALTLAEFRRAEAISGSGALSKEETERRRASSVTDDARVKVAAAMLAEAQARLELTEIRAPADGIVLTRTAEIGQTAAPGGPPLFRLARDGEIEMRGQIAEQDLATLKIGQPADVYVSGIAAPFPGKLRLLGAVIDPQTRLGEVRVALEASPLLRPGAFARGQITVDQARRPVLPQTAVLSDSNGSYVFIVNEANEVKRLAVRVASTVPEGIVIAEGLKGDERVITTAGGFLREGERVAVAPPEPDKP